MVYLDYAGATDYRDSGCKRLALENWEGNSGDVAQLKYQQMIAKQNSNGSSCVALHGAAHR